MSVKITGARELVKALEDLPKFVQADVLEQSGTDALEPMRRDYQDRAPAFLEGKIRTRVLSKAPRFVKLATGTKHPLAHIFEYGTRLRRRKSGGITGRIRERAFARPAFDGNAAKTLRSLGTHLWARIRHAGR